MATTKAQPVKVIVPAKAAATSAPKPTTPAPAGVSFDSLTKEAQEVRDLVAELVTLVNKEDDDEPAARFAKGAAATLSKAVEAWATTQAAEVLTGVRPLSRWREYRADLKKQAEGQQTDAKGRAGFLTRAANAVGAKLSEAADEVNAKVRELREKYTKIVATRARVEAAKAKLDRAKMDAKTREELYGAPSAKAQASLEQLASILRAIETGAKAVTGLGALPVLGAGAAAASVAIALALASSLWAYFNHADELVRAEVARQEFELVKAGKGAEVEALRKLRNESDKARSEDNPSPFASLASVAKWVGFSLLGVAALGVGREVVRNMPQRPGAAR
jgi:NADH dehydrogenase/NADH:ubiquinone oxidoreductase subunit G